jgi:bacterioferritin
MKGDPKVIAKLNSLLASEHSAIVQYSTHARMVANWGYSKLVDYITERMNQEREHAQELIDRILFLEGVPLFENIDAVNVGSTVLEMFPNDQTSEITAITAYTEGIELAAAEKDYTTRALLEHILGEEQKHLNDIESNIYQITQSGVDNYLIAQIGG